MSAGQSYYSTKTLHRPPSKTDFLQVDVHNDWDILAEAAIPSYPEPSAQLDHLAILLESHGVVVHRVSAPHPHLFPSAPRSPFVLDPYASPTRMKGTTNDAPKDNIAVNSPPFSLFPQNAALVHGTRVIQVPPPAPLRSSQSDKGQTTCGLDEHGNALFSLLENAGVEVVRWSTPSPSSGLLKTPEGKLVDIEETTDPRDAEEDGPRFSPSDILILSPTLLITRLSSYTNNKGLEYLWSISSRPSATKDEKRHDTSGDGRATTPGRASLINAPRPITTLVVRITEPDPPIVNSPVVPPSATYSPRAASFASAQLTPRHGSAAYTPLTRALVPLDGRIMLYDPALVGQGEARRLKSVLDRVQEGSRGVGGGGGDMSELFTARSSKRDSGMSYGTFGGTDKSDDEGWQFISVDGLHSTSICLVSPQLALLSRAPVASMVSMSSDPLNQDILTSVSHVLESFGIRTVSLPFAELNERGGGVRDAIMVLRRESNISLDDGDVEDEHQDAWGQPPAPGEEPTEGCFEAIIASIATCFCGSMTNTPSEADISE